jgi:uncharacterized protein YoxC
MAKPNYAALLASIAQKDREIKTLTVEIADLTSKIGDASRSQSQKNADTTTKTSKESQKTSKEAAKAVDITNCYKFPEPITEAEKDLFNYVSDAYISNNPGTTTSYVGKYYGENGELQ